MNKRVRSRVVVSMFAAMGLAAGATGQNAESLTLSIEWDKAVIGHGETNAGKLLATVGPEIGSVTAWNTMPGTGQLGTLKAFASVLFHFKGVENGLNGNFTWTIPAEFQLDTKPGWTWPTGGTKSETAAQMGLPSNPDPNVNQTVTVMTFAWKETAGGGPYNVLFETEILVAKVFLDVGLSGWVGEYAAKFDDQAGFTVIPSPATMSVLIPLFLAASRRRSRP